METVKTIGLTFDKNPDSTTNTDNNKYFNRTNPIMKLTNIERIHRVSYIILQALKVQLLQQCFNLVQASGDPYAELHLGLVLCLLVRQLWVRLFQTAYDALDTTYGRQALHL